MTSRDFIKDWKFIKEDKPEFSKFEYDHSNWRTVDIPHDYAIEGPFSESNDIQNIKVEADGIHDSILHVGRTGGLPITQIAWYRKSFKVSESAEKVFIEFDGIMNNSSVYVNGSFVGFRHYGYSSFSYDITEFVQSEKENILAVRVAPESCASRWYPGAGIYRFVRLVEKSDMYIPYNGTYIVSDIADNKAIIKCEIKAECSGNAELMEAAVLETTILDEDGKAAAYIVNKGLETINIQALEITNPKLWSLESPTLYTAISVLSIDKCIKDEYKTRFGIRSLNFTKDKGFFLNGSYTKLNGVCMHHDLGALGTAINKSAIKRQLAKLKDMGCNSIRTSHNPPAPEMLDLCDEMGFLVIDEAFDEWKYPKVNNGYFKYFDEWAEKDLLSLIYRDRNHPCVFMWSIGNEILDQKHEDGAATAKWLTGICHREDPTRPTTAGFNMPEDAIRNGLCDEVDIVGLNYKPFFYDSYHREHPDWIIYGSETESCVSSRGEYIIDAKPAFPAVKRENFHIPSYDLEGPEWAYSPDREFEAQDDFVHVLGEYVWTGFDYLGEPTPYRAEWPSRSSYFGILDLCGLEKDRFYSYKSKWTNEKVLHLLPHWNWQAGQKISVHCYSSFPRVELFLNDKSLGIKEKHSENCYTKHRLIWENVEFSPGILRAVAVDEPEAFCEIRTAKAPYAIRMTPEKTHINADIDELYYIRCDIVDEEGVICPLASDTVHFDVGGAGVYVAADAGDQASTRSFHENYCEAFHGSLIVIVKLKENGSGCIRVTAMAEGLKGTECRITKQKTQNFYILT